MSTASQTYIKVVGLSLLIAIIGLPAQAGTDQGSYAASQVDRLQYEYVHGELLFTHEGDDRYSLDGDHDQARDNIRDRLASYGLTTTLEPFAAFGYTWYNVVAELPGTTRPNDIYIIGAHYDTFSFEGSPAPGADDDASGVAAVVEAARLLSQWPSEATIRFIAFDREEQGLFGSRWHASAHSAENIRGMLSLDMLAYRKTVHNRASIYGHPASNGVRFSLLAALQEYGGLAAELDGVNDQSDHSPFEYLGFQAAFVTEYDEPINTIYHHAHDSLENPGYIDYEYATAFTRGVTGWLVDQAGVRPTPPVGDMNGDYNVDEGDIGAFVLALSGQTAYEARYPNGRWLNADCNGDGVVSFADINAFVALLKQGCAGPQFVAKLHASDGTGGEYFGAAVAVSGNTALCAAPGANAAAGAVYVNERVGGLWAQTAVLTAADATAGDRFGNSVAIDGDIAVVGARFDGDLGSTSGSAYVFERTSGVWTQSAKLLASDGAASDRFGQQVAISGQTIVIGAPFDDDHAANSGSAYVFERVGGFWTQTAKLTASDAAASDNFGISAAISGDTILVGAYLDDAPETDRGSAYVFTRTGGGWTQQAKLVATGAVAGDRFGAAVAVSGDTAVIGAYRYLVGGGPATAHVFTRTGGVWNQTAKLASWTHTSGIAVAVDGLTVVAGRSGGNLTPDPAVYDTGEVYVFTQQGGLWQQSGKLYPSDAVPTDYFGSSVAVSGATVVVGAVQNDDLGTDSGATYVLAARASGVPQLTQRPLDQIAPVAGQATFAAQANGPRTIAYQWYKDGDLLLDSDRISGTATATLTINPVAEGDAGTYAVVVTSPCGATSTTATLTILPAE